MTQTEIEIARALCYDCQFYAQGQEARFILDMAERADKERQLPTDSQERQELTEKQRAWLFDLVHKYRRQIPVLHRLHCPRKDCQLQMKNEAKKRRTQLCLF